MLLILFITFFRRKNSAICLIEPTKTCVKQKNECIFVTRFRLILNNEKRNYKMVSEDLDIIFQEFIPKKEWQFIKKATIKFNDVVLLKWISLGNKNIYRRYYIKVTFKDQKVKHISISKSTKDQLKQNIKPFNQYLKGGDL